MRRSFITLLLMLSISASAQESLKARMERIENDFGVSFVYASTLSVDSMVAAGPEYGTELAAVLKNTFAGTGIRYEVRKRNVILSKEKAGRVARRTVCGYITDRNDGETLIGAAVYAKRNGAVPVGTVTNEYGFYTLTLEEGEYLLEASYLGYSAQRLNVDMTRDRNISFSMVPDAVIEAAAITAGRDAGVASARAGSTILSSTLIENTAAVFGEPDILKTLQMLPGVQNAMDGFSGINVRGGGVDENLILLDGSALYNTEHLLGLTSVFSPEMVKKVTVYKSAFPARYGGRTSSVVDVRTKDGNLKETHGLVSLGLISDKVYVEGPLKKDKASFSVSGRMMQTGVFAPVMKAFGVPANYWFYDLNAKLSWILTERDRLYAGFFNGNDVFKFSDQEENYLHYYDENYAAYDRYVTGTNNLRLLWGNMLGTLRWSHIYSPKMFSNLTVAANRYNMNLSHGQEMNVNDDGIESYSGSFFSMSSGIKDLHSQLDFDYTPVPEHKVKFGAELIGHHFRPEASFGIERSGEAGQTFKDRRTDIQKGTLHTGVEASIYAEDNMEILGWLTVCPGLRLSTYFADGGTYVIPEPRLSLKADINEALFTKLSATRMAQYVHMLSSGNTSLPTDMWVPVTKDIKPLVSDQISAGIYYTGISDWEFSAEGYWKTMDNVLEYLEVNPSLFSSVNWENNVAMGQGRSYGLELMAEKTAGKATGLVAYTLSKSDRVFPDGSINKGERFPYTYDRRHKLNAMLNYSFSRRVDATASFTFASGSWYTLPARYVLSAGPEKYLDMDLCITERNNYRLPPSHHLDLGVNFRKSKARGERIWNISIYNVYGAHNPTLLDISTNDSVFENKDIPDGAIVITRRSFFLFLPSVNYTRKF